MEKSDICSLHTRKDSAEKDKSQPSKLVDTNNTNYRNTQAIQPSTFYSFLLVFLTFSTIDQN